MNRFIGVLVNDSGTFDIADPMVNPIACEQLSIPRENQTILKVRNALPGIYDALHTINKTNEVTELLVLHQTYRVEDLDDNPPFCSGVVCSALSHSVCIVDERYHFDPTYSYYKLESDAFYDGDEIIKRLPSSPYPTTIKETLVSLIQKLRAEGKHPTGEDIYKVVMDYGIWDAFCSNKIYSSHWSIDVYNRIDGFIPAAVFKGGVVTRAYPDFLSCYIYRNNRGKAYAIRILLNKYDVVHKHMESELAEVIRFPEKLNPSIDPE